MQYLLALIGYPVAHSLSPAMHNAALAHFDLAGEYVLVPVEPERVVEAVSDLRARGFAGFNVTIPHKEAVFRLSRQRTEEASQVGVANTIKFLEPDEMLAHNTDVEGFARAVKLLQDGRAPLERACVLGNGGAARAAVQALFRMGLEQVMVLGRTRERLEHFASELEECARNSASTVWNRRQLLLATPETISGALTSGSFDLIVNSTPVGQGSGQEIPGWMSETLEMAAARRKDPCATATGADAQESKRPSPLLFYDMVYSRGSQPTPLVARARALGFQACDGLEMLVQQAALSFQFWTGRAVPPEVMRNAALGAINS